MTIRVVSFPRFGIAVELDDSMIPMAKENGLCLEKKLHNVDLQSSMTFNACNSIHENHSRILAEEFDDLNQHGDNESVASNNNANDKETSDEELLDQILHIVSSNVCKTLTLQQPSGDCSSTTMGIINNRLVDAISRRNHPLDELVICGLELSLANVIQWNHIIKTDQMLAVYLQDIVTTSSGGWANNSIEFVVDILASAVAQTKRLESFRLCRSICCCNNNGMMLSDRHIAKIVQTAFVNHPSLSHIEISFPYWYMSTLQVILGKLLLCDSPATSSHPCPPLKSVILNRQQQSFGKVYSQQTQKLHLASYLGKIKSSSLSSLERLSLCSCNLDNQHFQLLLEKFPNLKDLDLSGNSISSLKLHGIDNVPIGSPLRKLTLIGNPISATSTSRRQQHHAIRQVNNACSTIVWKKEQEYLQRLLTGYPCLGELILGNNERLSFNEDFLLYTLQNEHLLDLNLSGGRLLLLPTALRQQQDKEVDVPLSLWPIVFERTACTNNKESCRRSASLIYHLLRDHFYQGPSMFYF